MFTLRSRGALLKNHLFSPFKGLKMTENGNMPCRYVANNNLIYIAFPQAPVYLKQDRLFEKIKTESRISRGLDKYCSGARAVYFAFPKNDCQSDLHDRYIHSAIKSQRLYRQSAIWNVFSFAHCVSFSKKTLDSSLENESWIKRGVCIYQETDSDVKDIEENLFSFLKENEFAVGSVSLSGSKQLLWRNLANSEEKTGPKSKEELSIVCVEPSDVASQLKESYVSPIFTLPLLSPVFHTFQDARNVLEKCLDLPEVVELLEITDKHVCDKTNTQLRHPFVVVEGMDATGKTTLTQILEEKLGAVRYYTPPPQVQHLRAFFDKLPEIVRRAYYCMGNHIVAQDIIKECQTRPVIMDRFWHSTTAYGIANETSSGDMPRAGHSVYHWPMDLLKPTLVLFLTVSEEVRKQRLSGRGLGSTFEEKSLDKDQLFRQRLCDSYRRMEAPSCLEIDASGTVEEVSSLAQKALQQHGIQLNVGKANSAVS